MLIYTPEQLHIWDPEDLTHEFPPQETMMLSFAGRRCVHLATLIPSWSSQCCVLQQQKQRTFGAWTKAKKKRQARWERNQALKAANRFRDSSVGATPHKTQAVILGSVRI